MNKPLQFTATCLTAAQVQVCTELGIPVFHEYACSLGEIAPGCVTDFSLHCFNSAALALYHSMGVTRATLHPELNLPQIRDMVKPIPTEAVIYGKIPLMRLGASRPSSVTDRTNAYFYIHTTKKGTTLYNAVPIFLADKLNEIENAGITHGRLMFTDETAAQTRTIIRAYKLRKSVKIPFTRGKFFAKRDIP
jgi:putative protease